MKRLLVLSSILVLFASCDKLEGEIKIKPGETISNKDVSLKFLDYQDSRCPEGVSCITAGDCAVWMEISDGSTTLPFTIGDQASAYEKEFTGLNYNIRYIDLQPHPKQGVDLSANDIKLHLIVTKQ